MRIDPVTLLFEDLTDDEAEDLLSWSARVVLHGEVHPCPPWVDLWIAVGGYDDRQRLLLVATALPARALLSVARRSSSRRRPTPLFSPAAPRLRDEDAPQKSPEGVRK